MAILCSLPRLYLKFAALKWAKISISERKKAAKPLNNELRNLQIWRDETTNLRGSISMETGEFDHEVAPFLIILDDIFGVLFFISIEACVLLFRLFLKPSPFHHVSRKIFFK